MLYDTVTSLPKAFFIYLSYAYITQVKDEAAKFLFAFSVRENLILILTRTDLWVFMISRNDKVRYMPKIR